MEMIQKAHAKLTFEARPPPMREEKVAAHPPASAKLLVEEHQPQHFVLHVLVETLTAVKLSPVS
jgi:hypothetical protein